MLTVRGVVGLERLSKNRLSIPDLSSDSRLPVPDKALVPSQLAERLYVGRRA